MSIYFDVETGPQSDEQLALVKPVFEAAKNLKDPEKIKADLEAKEADWLKDAALSPITGRVLCIGFLKDAVEFLQADDERVLLSAFWDEWAKGERMIGYACKHFDARFVYVRSIFLRVPVPKDLFSGRYWNPRLCDLQEIVTCFTRDIRGYSLDAVCKAAGLGGKSGDGEFFHQLWATDREAALSYLGRDLELTAALGRLLGIDNSPVPF